MGPWLQWAILPTPDGEDVRALAPKEADYDLELDVPRGIANHHDFPLVGEFLSRSCFTEFIFNNLPTENLERQKAMMDHCFEHIKPKIAALVDGCNKRESQRLRNFERNRQNQPANPRQGPPAAPLLTSESSLQFQNIPVPSKPAKKQKRRDSTSSESSDDDTPDSSTDSEPAKRKGKTHKKKKASKSKAHRK